MISQILSLVTSNKKIVGYSILTILAVFLIWKYSAKIEGGIKKLFGKSGGDYTEPPVESSRYISDLANRLYTVIYNPIATSGDKETLLIEALKLNDADLEKLANEYKQKSGNSLYKDVDDEFLPFITQDEDIMARLKELNKQ